MVIFFASNFTHDSLQSVAKLAMISLDCIWQIDYVESAQK